MNEHQARKTLGLKPKENPRARMIDFEENLERKQGFVDNSPSEETKTRYQAELDEYQTALTLMNEAYPPKKRSGHLGLIVSLIIIIAAGSGVWWKINEDHRQQELEAQRQEQQFQEQVRVQNLRRIAEFESEGLVATSKRKWGKAQKAFDAILGIDPHSPIAQAGFDAIRQGKLEEKNQKIFYTLGNSQAALEAGKWEEARGLAQSVLDQNPAHPEAQAKLQLIAEQRHQHEVKIKVRMVTRALESGQLPEAQRALKILKKAASEHPQVSELSRRINAALAELQARQQKAIALLNQAKQLDHGQFSPEAITLLDEAKRLDPQNPDVVTLHQKISNYTRTIQVPGDFPTIAEALSVARPRDRILIAAGTYREALNIDQVVRLEGSADGKTILELPSEESPIITITATAAGTHLSGLTLKHTGFDLDKDRASAVIVQGGKATISACQISRAAGHGIAVIGGAKVTISGCQISRSGWDGISVYGEGSWADIQDTTSEHNLQQGVGFWKGGGGKVMNGRMLANGLCGILAMSPGTMISIQTTLCARNRGAGILVSDQVTAEITANRCDKNLLSGIVARGEGTIVSVINCIATGNQEAGILIHAKVTRLAFTKNKASANKRRQIWLDAVIK